MAPLDSVWPVVLITSLCLIGVALVYVIYPVVLCLLPQRQAVMDEGARPAVTLFVSAFNERDVIGEKLENVVALDYPADRLEVVVVSDASDDGTDEIVRDFEGRSGGPAVRLHRQAVRRGKTAGLVRAVEAGGYAEAGRVLVFSDANSIYEPDAVLKLVRHFVDPEVGFVAGHQRYYDSDAAAGEGESLYWRYETAVKIRESQVGSVVCGDGAIYAVRGELFEPMRPDDINDFALPLKILIRGYRGVFDPEAVCYEHAADEVSGEFRRRVRIVNRSFRAVCRNWRAMSPAHVGLFAVQLFVHKVLRWWVPLLLLVALVGSAWLASTGSIVWLAVFGGQAACYLAAAAYAVPAARKLRAVRVCYYFCVANAAAALGLATFLSGRNFQTWKPERPAERLAAEVAP